jgi:hypothetical protein
MEGAAVHSRTILYANFSPGEHANLLAAKATAYASGFLDGRSDATQLAQNAHALFCELISAPEDATAKAILIPTRLLNAAMLRAAAAQDAARLDRWMHVMAALIELVRQECKAHKPGPVDIANPEAN